MNIKMNSSCSQKNAYKLKIKTSRVLSVCFLSNSEHKNGMLNFRTLVVFHYSHTLPCPPMVFRATVHHD